MRLIDADALMERMTKAMEGGSNLNGTFHLHIEHAPTIDAVEVVRCKDCMRYMMKQADAQSVNAEKGESHE